MDIGQTLRSIGVKAKSIFKSKPVFNANSNVPPAQDGEIQEPVLKKKKNYKVLLVLLLLFLVPLYYILGAVFAHKINDNLDFKVIKPETGKSHTIAVVSGLIDREVNKTKWAPNTQMFEPAALLRYGGNMVNFQSGIIRALNTSVYEIENRLARVRGTSAADADMSAARQGLSRSPETWILDPLPTSSADGEYRKALAALNRYNNRLASGQASFEVRSDNLQGILEHIALDLGGVSDSLDKQIVAGQKVFIDRRADKLFYYSKGQAYAYFIVLRALREDYAPIIAERRIGTLYEDMLQQLGKAAEMQPVMVQNASMDSYFLPNHLAAEGFYILRARARLREITDILQR